jgi:hypothetical protein
VEKIQLTTQTGVRILVDADKILCNDVVIPGEHARHDTHLWLCLHARGPLGAVWATSAEDALDELVDQDMAGEILVPEDVLNRMTQDERLELAHHGTHDEEVDLRDVTVEPVKFEPSRDWYLLCRFAEARGAERENLES